MSLTISDYLFTVEEENYKSLNELRKIKYFELVCLCSLKKIGPVLILGNKGQSPKYNPIDSHSEIEAEISQPFLKSEGMSKNVS